MSHLNLTDTHWGEEQRGRRCLRLMEADLSLLLPTVIRKYVSGGARLQHDNVLVVSVVVVVTIVEVFQGTSCSILPSSELI